VKVLEALAAGKVIVASRLAVKRFDINDGRACVSAETDEELATRILRLLDDDEERGASRHEAALVGIRASVVVRRGGGI